MEVHFQNSRGEQLVGNFHKAGGKCVIVSHGFASNKENVSVYARFLQALGYSTLSFDYSGHGESEGDMKDTSAALWREDLYSAIGFAGRHCSEIALLGFSLGAAASLLCSGRSLATIAIAPPSNFTTLHEYFRETGLMRDEGGLINFGGNMVRRSFVEDIPTMEPVLKGIRCPILIIHGDKDDVVPLRQSEEAIKYINEPKKLFIVNGMDHNTATAEQFAAVKAETEGWLKKYLG